METKIHGLRKFQVTNREECGVIVLREENNSKSLHIYRVPNRAESGRDFEIWEEDLLKIEKVMHDSETLYGFMHTHLKDQTHYPSPLDIDGANLNPIMKNLVYQPSTKKKTWYDSNGVLEKV